MSNLREIIGKTIIDRFEIGYQEHNINYDPDTCWEAADDIIAALVGELTGQKCTAIRTEGFIGAMGFSLEPDRL